MSLTREQLHDRIDDLHLDELDLIITRDGDGFAVTESRGCRSYVSDIGSSYEVPDAADEHGRHAFTAGPWTAYQYHSSYTAPNRGNYAREIEDLVNGDASKVVVGVTAVFEEESDAGTWVFGIRTVE
ncbi:MULTISPECIES: hypothetical protein [Mycobacteriaceae]|uniref:Uncharacterized protein n=4 Tax=Mycobacteriaceae TaxID=1762 RepID=A0A1S1JQ03_9MYCO|nr:MULTISPECIES: hypothetical protein [Mycobacteriaceae]MBP2451779.1 hypothetical protein [Mycolicibacterium lutetiense]OHT88325.1 hypothetical protein BKG61_27680 [Mycobacterium syngnathidarum]OLT97686.1 hypothetical protein BKG60_04770 [Mycobacterium syngnathidarum]